QGSAEENSWDHPQPGTLAIPPRSGMALQALRFKCLEAHFDIARVDVVVACLLHGAVLGRAQRLTLDPGLDDLGSHRASRVAVEFGQARFHAGWAASRVAYAPIFGPAWIQMPQGVQPPVPLTVSAVLTDSACLTIEQFLYRQRAVRTKQW